jgi:hypothetical protein
MVMDDPATAARDLAEAEQRRRRGAELAVTPYSRWWYLPICLIFTLWGSSSDIPLAWRWLPMLGIPAVLIITLVMAPPKARPLPFRFGWRSWLVVWSIAVAGIAASLGLGVALRAVAVPLPFTLSGLLLGVGVCFVVRWSWRWRVNYVEQVAKGPW